MENYIIFLIFCITLFTETFFPIKKKTQHFQNQTPSDGYFRSKVAGPSGILISWSLHKLYQELGCKQTGKQDTAWRHIFDNFQYKNMNQHRGFSTSKYHKKHANLRKVEKKIAFTKCTLAVPAEKQDLQKTTHEWEVQGDV